MLGFAAITEVALCDQPRATPQPPFVPIYQGTYLFLQDHYVDRVIYRGTVQAMFTPWVPTANVDPLDTTAVNVFYAMGPILPGHLDTQSIPPASAGFFLMSATHWYQISPEVWALTGLGSNQSVYPPISKKVDSPPP